MTLLQKIKPDKKVLFIRWFSIINILEGMLVILSTLLIEADPKNAVFLGFSKSRLILVGVVIVLLAIQILLLLKSRKIVDRIKALFEPGKTPGWLPWLGILSTILLWLTIWLPANRLLLYAATFVRFRPFLLWLELIAFQFYLAIKLIRNEVDLNFFKRTINKNKRKLILVFGLAAFSFLVFYILRSFGTNNSENQFYFPPSAPFSTLQLLSIWIIFLCLFLFERNANSSVIQTKWWAILTFFLIWFTTIAIWNLTPLACTDDRPGPFPPNNICYPTINDAVYSIGSHYITLGQGIYHHWLTDKPLYMVFLAIGQWIAGPGIDQYLTFQITVLALIPAVMFLIGKRFNGFAGGVFFSFFGVLSGYNAINLYQQAGGVNAKLENPELLTAFLMVFLCFAIIKWFEKPFSYFWAVMSGGIFGASLLVRYNPIFVAPILLLVFITVNRKNKKISLVGPCLFLLSTLLVITPWFVNAHDSNGNNFYISKIQNVFSSRYGNISTPTETGTTIQLTQVPTNNSSPTESSKSDLLNYPQQVVDKSDFTAIFYHFLNNEYLHLGVFPVNFSILSSTDQVKQPIWDFSYSNPFWKANLSVENEIVLAITLLVVLLGIVALASKFGVIGLIPLLIQIGYHLGNAFAKTSGSRYLQPVNWVTYFYFSTGLIILSVFIINFLRTRKISQFNFNKINIQKTNLNSQITNKIFSPKLLATLSLMLAIGLILPIANNLPNQLPDETSQELKNKVSEQLIAQGTLSPEQWQTFSSSSQSMVVQGVAYHPRTYRPTFYRVGDRSFELMVLGKDHVIVSYQYNQEPTAHFADGSSVILVGCKVGSDSLWGAERIIMQTIAVIQTDHEKSVLIDQKTSWSCAQK